MGRHPTVRLSGRVRIAFAITRAASIDETWTTVHLARAALERGFGVRFIEPWDFEIDARGRVIARAHAYDSPASGEAIGQGLSRRRAPRRYVDLEKVDMLLMRAAPLDLGVLAFAELAKERGVRVVNDPAGLMRVTHKAWLASLPADVPRPPAVVTRSRATAHLFANGQPDGVVVKPARGSGGRAVSLVDRGDDVALDEAFDLARDRGDRYVVVQSYLATAARGEKRLVWLDGRVLGGYLRRRAPGEFRHNLKRGAVAEATDVSDEERDAVARLSPHLLQAGIRLAGLDMIGGQLIEVNALNPGGAYHTDRLTGSRLGETILTRLIQPEESEAPWAVPVP